MESYLNSIVGYGIMLYKLVHVFFDDAKDLILIRLMAKNPGYDICIILGVVAITNITVSS